MPKKRELKEKIADLEHQIAVAETVRRMNAMPIHLPAPVFPSEGLIDFFDFPGGEVLIVHRSPRNSMSNDSVLKLVSIAETTRRYLLGFSGEDDL